MKSVSEFLKNSIEPIVRSIVDSPEKVEITIVLTTKNINIQISADKTDYGKIIGKEGKTVNSLKIISSAMKNTNFPSDLRTIVIEILDDETPSFDYVKKQVN